MRQYGGIIIDMGDFEIHKLEIETLAEYLLSVRADLGFSKEEVTQKTGIALKLLTAIETSNFRVMPEPVYVVGFIKKLAALYAIPCEPLVQQFYREALIAEHEEFPGASFTWKTLAQRLTPLRWTLLASVAGGSLFIVVCMWQIFAIGKVPAVSVTTPKANERIQGSLITVSGLATPGSEVALNGQTVFAGSDGKFSSSVGFFSGTQTLTVTAKSRFGKVATKTVQFMVEAGSGDPVGPFLPTATSALPHGLSTAMASRKTK